MKRKNRLITISKSWRYNLYDMPDGCMSCPEQNNGIYYGFIKINGLKISINLCDKCLNKLKQKIK